MQKHVLLSFVFAAVFVLCGCEDRQLPDDTVSYISVSAHNYLDPQRLSWTHDIRLVRNMYEPLVTYDFSTFEIKPGVADRWEISEDERTYTFHLRNNAKWSNGDPVLSTDFSYAWMRAILPDQASAYAELLYPIKGARAFYNWRIKALEQFAKGGDSGNQQAADALWAKTQKQFSELVGISTPDERTVVVELDHPTPYFLELVAFITYSPVHQSSVEAQSSVSAASGSYITDSTYWSDAERLLTNGPYMLNERRFKQWVYLVANPFFWNRDALKNEAVFERIVESPETAFRVYEDEREKIDMWFNVPTSGSLAEYLANKKRPDVHVGKGAGTYFYNYNCQERLPNGEANPLADARVRRAMSMAIDRTYLVDRVTQMHQPIAKTFIPPGIMKDYDVPVEYGVTFHPEEAQKLLAEAGYPNGKGFPSLTLMYNTGNFHETLAQAVIIMWEQHLNIHVRLEGLETKVFGDRMRKRDFDIARAGWFGDYPDPTTFLNKVAEGSSNNDPGWHNKEYNQLLEEAAATLDPKKRMALLRDAEIVMLQEQPMALIYQYVEIRLYDTRHVKGVAEQANAWGRWNFMDMEVVLDREPRE